MRITCFDNRYTIEASDIVYQYDPLNDKKYKTYKAEDVIANNGDSNTIALIKDPKLFCNATFFFVENLFADVFDAAQNAESEWWNPFIQVSDNTITGSGLNKRPYPRNNS